MYTCYFLFSPHRHEQQYSLPQTLEATTFWTEIVLCHSGLIFPFIFRMIDKLSEVDVFLLSLKTRATSNRFSIVHVAGSFSNGWDTSRCSLYSECWTFALTRSSSSSSICEHAKWFKQKREIVMLLLLMMPPPLLLLLLLCQCKQSSRDVEKMKWNQN